MKEFFYELVGIHKRVDFVMMNDSPGIDFHGLDWTTVMEPVLVTKNVFFCVYFAMMFHFCCLTLINSVVVAVHMIYVFNES